MKIVFVTFNFSSSVTRTGTFNKTNFRKISCRARLIFITNDLLKGQNKPDLGIQNDVRSLPKTVKYQK